MISPALDLLFLTAPEAAHDPFADVMDRPDRIPDFARPNSPGEIAADADARGALTRALAVSEEKFRLVACGMFSARSGAGKLAAESWFAVHGAALRLLVDPAAAEVALYHDRNTGEIVDPTGPDAVREVRSVLGLLARNSADIFAALARKAWPGTPAPCSCGDPGCPFGRVQALLAELPGKEAPDA